MKASVTRKVAAAGAITGGLVGSGHAATVQITLVGNMISSGGGNQLNADLTGDSINDVNFSNSVTGNYRAVVNVNSGMLSAGGSSITQLVDAQFAGGGVGTVSDTGYPQASATYLNPITFSDPAINGGAMTGGYLEVYAFSNAGNFATITNGIVQGGSHLVQLTRLVFDDASTMRPDAMNVSTTETYTEFVPEPSSLALLALGAGGLMARRKREQAAA